MKNPVIAKMLKYYRKSNNLSVDDIAAYLDECGISVANKTIYGWESGQTHRMLIYFYIFANFTVSLMYWELSDIPRKK